MYPRHGEAFPVLTPREIERMRRFGVVQRFGDGEFLCKAGEPGPGMFVVLSGRVVITQRDGLRHITPLVEHGPGNFSGEVGQLSNRASLVDGRAEGEVEALL